MDKEHLGEAMDTELFKRFTTSRDSRQNDGSDCYRCKFGKSFEYLERLTTAPELYRNWPNYRDGCLVQTSFKPKADSKQCQGCFEGWLEDRKDEGKICIKCDKWIVGGKSKAAMCIEAVYEGGSHTYHSVCEPCLLQGKTVDEWARGVVQKSKANKHRLEEVEPNR